MDTDYDAAGDLIRKRLRDLAQTQEWLGEMVGELMGTEPPRQTTVSAWVNGVQRPRSPELVFAIETALRFRAGQLSRHYGFLPPDAKDVGGSVEAAIRSDPGLSAVAKRALLACYRELRKG